MVNGDQIFMYETSSLNFATTNTSILTLGTYSTPFSVRTRNAKGTPDQFNFNVLNNVDINQEYVSISTSITGTDNNIPLPAFISFPGELQVNTDAYVSGTTEVFNNDVVRLRIPASAVREYGTSYLAQLTISGITGTFRINTRPRPIKTFPDQFTFQDLVGVAPGALVESARVRLSGMTNGENDTGTASISGGGAEFRVFRNGSVIRDYSSASFPVLNSDEIQIRLTSAGEGSTIQARFIVSGTDTRTVINGVNGSTSDTWDVNSRSLRCRVDDGAFSLTNVENARIRESRTVSFTVSGLDNGCDTIITTSNPDSFIRNQNGTQVASNQALDISNGDRITIGMTAAATYSTNKETVVTCRRRGGGDSVSRTWVIRTQAEDRLPDPFNLPSRNQSSVSPCTFRTTFVTESLSGLSEETVVPASVTSTNGTAEISRNGGTFATSIPGGVRNGDRIDIRMRSNCSFGGSCETATVTVGDRVDNWQLCPEGVPFPTVNLQSNATSIANGGSVTLTWTSTFADRVSASSGPGFGSVSATSGTLTINNLTSSTTFSITVANARGTATSSVNISVAAPPPPPPPEPPPPPPCCDEYYIYRYGGGQTITRTATITHFYNNATSTDISLTVSGDSFVVRAINTGSSNTTGLGSRYYEFDLSRLNLLEGVRYTVSVSSISSTTANGDLTIANITLVPGFPSYTNSGFTIAFQRQGVASLSEPSTSLFGTFCRQFTITLTQDAVSRRGRWYKSSPQFNTWFPVVSSCLDDMKSAQDVYVEVLNRPAGINEIEGAVDIVRTSGVNTLRSNLLSSTERTSIISSGNPLDINNKNFNRSYPKTSCNRDYSSLPVEIFFDTTFSDNPQDTTRDLRRNGIFSACSGAPTVSLSASSTTVSHNGSLTLTWTSSNATSVAYSNFGASSVGGSITLSNLTSTTSVSIVRIYTIRVAGPGGIATRSVTVTILPPRPSLSLTANPSTVDFNGSTTLTWSSANASSVVSSNFGATTINGNTTITNLTSNRRFTISVSGSGGSTETSVDVTVRAQAPTVNLCATVFVPTNPTDPLPTGTTTSSGTLLTNTKTCESSITVDYAAYVLLEWTSTNATSISSSGTGFSLSSSQTNGSFLIPYQFKSQANFSVTVTGNGSTATDSITVIPRTCSAVTTQDSLAKYKNARSTFGNGTIGGGASGYEAYYETVTTASLPNRPNYTYRRLHAFIYNNFIFLLGRPPEKTAIVSYTNDFNNQPSIFRTFDELFYSIKFNAATELSDIAARGGRTGVIDTCGNTWTTSSPTPNVFDCGPTIQQIRDTATNAIYQKGFTVFLNGTNDSIQEYFVSSIDPNLRLPGRPEFTYGQLHGYIFSKYSDPNNVGGLSRPPEKGGLQTYVRLFQEKNPNGSYKYPDLKSLGDAITAGRTNELNIRTNNGGFLSILNECGQKWSLEGNGVYLDLRSLSGRVTVTLSIVASSSDVFHSVNIFQVDRIVEGEGPKTYELLGGRIYGPCSSSTGNVYIGNETIPSVRGSGSRPNTHLVIEENNDDWDDLVISTSAGVWTRFTAPSTK